MQVFSKKWKCQIHWLHKDLEIMFFCNSSSKANLRKDKIFIFRVVLKRCCGFVSIQSFCAILWTAFIICILLQSWCIRYFGDMRKDPSFDVQICKIFLLKQIQGSVKKYLEKTECCTTRWHNSESPFVTIKLTSRIT